MITNPLMIPLNNGTSIPQVGLGVYQTPDGETTVNAVRAALRAGYRHIDTAALYGNEVSVGQGVRESGVAREDVFVTTKLWNDDIRAGKTAEAFQASLDRLNLGYVDLYLIHWPAEGWQQAWRDMEKLYQQGVVKAIGVSNFQQHHLEELMSFATVKPVVDQIEESPRFANQELTDFCLKNDIAVEAWSPLGGTGGNLLQDPVLAQVAAEVGKSPAQVVIRWFIQRGVVVLPKSTLKERIEQNFDVFDFELSDEQMAKVSSLETGVRPGADPDNFNF